MVIRFVNVFALLVAQGLAVAFASVAAAQVSPPATLRSAFPNPIVAVPAASLNDFDAVLPLIATQAKVALVCESQPLHLTLAPKAAADLARRLGSSGLPLEETVKEVAAAYDYDVQRLTADTFLLTKRYTDQNDLPDVTFEETLASLQNIVDATQNYRPPVGPEDTLLDIIRTATAEQKAQLTQGIPVSQLPIEQRQMAWQFACGHNFHSLMGLARVTQRLNACKDRDTFFCYRQYLNLTYTAYQGPFAVNGLTDLFALSDWFDTGTGGGTGFDEEPGVHLVDGKIVVAPGVKDPTTPDGPAPHMTNSKLRLTLSDLAKQLSGRPVTGGITAAPVQVDPALARKTLCLTGAEYASSDSLIRAVCTMYGLERHDGYTINTITIAMPRPTILTDTHQIKTEIARLLPAAFLRAVRASDTQSRSAQNAVSDYSAKRASRLYTVSVRLLRGIVEPLLNKNVKHQLPVPDASDEARDLVALSSLVKCIPDIQSLAVPPPSFIDNFDRATFIVAQNGGDPNAFVYGFIYKPDQGRPSQIIGEMGYPQGTFGYGHRTGPGIRIKIGSVTVGM